MKKILVIIFMMLITTDIYAKEITLGNNKDYTDLSEAFNNLEDGDTLLIYPGNYGVAYDDIKKKFLILSNNNVSIKGVDENGKDFLDSDAVTNRIFQEEYIGDVEVFAFLEVTGKNNTLEGVHFTRNIENLPYLSVKSEANFSVNKIRMEYADSFYENTNYIEATVDIDKNLEEEFNLEYYNRVAPTYKAINLNDIEDIYSSEDESIVITYSNWAKNAYDYLAEKRFVPDYVYHNGKEDISRQLFVAMLTYCYEDVYGDIILTKLPKFEDIKDSPYRYEIMKGYSMGFISGVSNEKFGAMDDLTREQAAVILRNLVMEDGEIYSKNNYFTFKDDDYISSWAKDAVYYCYEKGILNGDSNGNFNPKVNLKNEEAVSLAYNYLKFLEN